MERKGLVVKNISSLTRGTVSRENISVDEILGWLLNISFAVLMVFVIANFLFTEDIKVALESAKDRQKVLEEENWRFRLGNPSIEKYEIKVKEAQKLKLILALDEIERVNRDNLAISSFAPKDPNTKETRYLMDDLLSGNKLISERFKNGCRIAKEMFSDKKELRQEWRKRIPLIVLDLELEFGDDPSKKSVVNHPEIVTPDNEIWLLQEISNRIEGIEADCHDMQSMALARFYEHYIKNPDLLKGTEIDQRIEKAILTIEKKEKERLVAQLSRELHSYIKLLFEREDVLLLDDV